MKAYVLVPHAASVGRDESQSGIALVWILIGWRDGNEFMGWRKEPGCLHKAQTLKGTSES